MADTWRAPEDTCQSSRGQTWVKSSKWSQEVTGDQDCRPLNITVAVIVNDDSRSVGDACRDLDEKGVRIK